MTDIRTRFVVDEQGNKTDAVVPIEHYLRILEELEELEPIRAFDMAKESADEAMPAEKTFSEIEKTSS